MKKTISVYTTCTNAIRDEYYIIEAVRSALLFADEVVVVDGVSDDDTVQQIMSIGDRRIKIYQNKWLDTIGTGMDSMNRSIAIGRCTSDFCILMDADEVFHEKDVDKIKNLAYEYLDKDIVAAKFCTKHFYKDYNHLLNGYSKWKDLYDSKIYMVKNGLCIHHGAIGEEPDAHVDCNGQSIPANKTLAKNIDVYHYGHVRSASAYVRKMNKLLGRFTGWTKKKTAENNFNWIDTNELQEFKGTHPAVMRERIREWEE